MARLLFCLLLLVLGAAPVPGSASTESPRVRLLASNPLPYLGEELILTLEFAYQQRPPGNLTLVWPLLDRFAIEELPPSRPRRVAVAGEAAEIIESQRLLLRPLAAGPVLLQGGGVRLADGRLLAAPDLPLRVRPLPGAGRPPGFRSPPGAIDLTLEAAGAGLREISISLRGNAWLQGFAVPTATPPRGGRLIPLGEEMAGVPGGPRSRTFRYLYDPGADPRALPSVDLTIFDPGHSQYRQLHAGRQNSGRSFPVIPVALSLLILFGLARHQLRRRRSLATLLRQLLGRSPQGLTSARIRQELAARGAAPATVALWEAWRRAEDEERFAPTPCGDKARRLRLRSLLRRALANDIDKRRGFPYLQQVRNREIPTQEVMR
ncbi:hypothetical protein JCM30471_34770 [Desulfuromonas carbonis]|nr:hypothetical protein DBW_2510 [Desulfuromonas sp. DDH964]